MASLKSYNDLENTYYVQRKILLILSNKICIYTNITPETAFVKVKSNERNSCECQSRFNTPHHSIPISDHLSFPIYAMNSQS